MKQTQFRPTCGTRPRRFLAGHTALGAREGNRSPLRCRRALTADTTDQSTHLPTYIQIRLQTQMRTASLHIFPRVSRTVSLPAHLPDHHLPPAATPQPTTDHLSITTLPSPTTNHRLPTPPQPITHQPSKPPSPTHHHHQQEQQPMTSTSPNAPSANSAAPSSPAATSSA